MPPLGLCAVCEPGARQAAGAGGTVSWPSREAAGAHDLWQGDGELVVGSVMTCRRGRCRRGPLGLGRPLLLSWLTAVLVWVPLVG